MLLDSLVHYFPFVLNLSMTSKVSSSFWVLFVCQKYLKLLVSCIMDAMSCIWWMIDFFQNPSWFSDIYLVRLIILLRSQSQRQQSELLRSIWLPRVCHSNLLHCILLIILSAVEMPKVILQRHLESLLISNQWCGKKVFLVRRSKEASSPTNYSNSRPPNHIGVASAPLRILNNLKPPTERKPASLDLKSGFTVDKQPAGLLDTLKWRGSEVYSNPHLSFTLMSFLVML